MGTRRRVCHGYTLTEMLVVLGIILLLIGILIPAIMLAQRQAKLTQCQARLRSVGQALQSYVTDYDQTLPPGITSNSKDSSMSRAALSSEGVNVSEGMMGGFKNPTKNQLQYFAGAMNFPYPSAPVAYFLRPYMPIQVGNWNCPALRTGKPGGFRTYQFVLSETPTPDEIKDGPLAGAKFGIEEFRPGYQYMSGVEHTWSINKADIDHDPWHKEQSAKYQYARLRERSISGLKLSEIKPRGGMMNTAMGGSPEAGSARSVVTMADYSMAAHSKSSDDMAYSEGEGSPSQPLASYTANFLFLDGHVETRTFKGSGGFISQLHGPIAQPW